MDDFGKEIGELKQFIADLKADRAAVKEKEKREAWTKYVSLTVVVIAVAASIAAQWSAKYSSRAQASQSHAFDTYNYYESKSLKKHMDQLGLPLLKSTHASDEESMKTLEKVEADISRYDGEMTNAINEAHEYESASKTSSAKGGKMGMAVSVFSISIAMASTCLLTKKKPLWLLAMALCALGVVEMIWGWVM